MGPPVEILRNVTTGTITTMLLKKGIRRSWMAAAMPFGFSGKRVVGPAFTLFPSVKILQRRRAGRSRYRRAAPLKPCRRIAWWLRMRWA